MLCAIIPLEGVVKGLGVLGCRVGLFLVSPVFSFDSVVACLLRVSGSLRSTL